MTTSDADSSIRRSSPSTSSTSSQSHRILLRRSAHEDVDDTETAALVGGHAFGKIACPADQPLNPQPGARGTTSHRKRESYPGGCAERDIASAKADDQARARSVLRRLMRCDCEHLQGSRDRARKVIEQIPTVEVQFVETHVSMHRV